MATEKEIADLATELKKKWLREYQKQWRKANKDKLKQYQNNTWTNKAKKILEAQEKEG